MIVHDKMVRCTLFQDNIIKCITVFLQLQGGPEIKSLAGIIAGSTMQSGRLNIPCSRSQEVDKARIKTKEVYEGTWKARLLTVKGFSKV